MYTVWEEQIFREILPQEAKVNFRKYLLCSLNKSQENGNIRKTDDKIKDGVEKECSNEISRNKNRVASDLEI